LLVKEGNKKMDKLLEKTAYDIRDVAEIFDRDTETIRSWERKEIISKPEERFDNGWRKYTPDTLAKLLQRILDYNWERNVIKNKDEIKEIIYKLKKKKYSDPANPFRRYNFND
jgi:DNA-binding transcriptional MerR regulator